MWYPQSVKIEDILYVYDKRGYLIGSRDIHRYDLHNEQWCEPLEYIYWRCGMTTVNSQLVMVGGADITTGRTTNSLRVYAPPGSWEEPYPPMNTPRYYPAVSTYNRRLVVAGGRDDVLLDLDTVEILDTSVRHSQWLSAVPLPMSCSRMSAAILHRTLYLLGGSLGKQVLSVSLSALTQADQLPAEWRTLPDAPLEFSTAIAVNGSVLAVGGRHGGQRNSAIHVYDQERNAWNKVGDLPTERQDCACCLLTNGEILVAGGADLNGSTNRMDMEAVKPL